MRILHTSDWHIGRTVRGRSRADEHRAVLAEIAGIAREREVDLVIVAGDVFDTAAPTPEAEQIAWRALVDLSRAAAHVVVLSGNHDNARRLEAVAPLLRLTNVHTGARVMRPDDGGVLALETASGDVAQVALLPFLSQRNVVRAHDLMTEDADQHSGAYADRCREIIGVLTAGFRDDTVNILVAHLFASGGKLGGGERDAHTIMDYFVPTQAFPATAHYVALGHLHRPQQLPAAAPTWYSGSPLQLDFGEEADQKAVLIVDAAPGTPAKVEEVPLTSGRAMRTVTGTIEQLRALAPDLGDAYLRVRVDEPGRSGLADEVREFLPDAVDVSVVPREEDQREQETWELDRFHASPTQLFHDYLQAQDIADPDLETLFAELLEDVHAPDPA